jgi:hypothetical protein
MGTFLQLSCRWSSLAYYLLFHLFEDVNLQSRNINFYAVAINVMR